jgi:TonB family protein
MTLLSGTETDMSLRNVLLMNVFVVAASFSASQTGTLQAPAPVLHNPPAAAVEPNTTPLVLELDRAILVLKQGLKENLATRDQYLSAFDETPNTDRAGRPVTDTKKYVECVMSAHLRTHQIWDEGPPIGVEAHRTIVELTKWRDAAAQGEAAELRPPPCADPALRKFTISAAVAARMVKSQVVPVYPADAIENHVFGTVVLHATISTKGVVEALYVISGPAPLQQATLDAVRQWTYRPYLLNNRPVEVETTINIVVPPSR